MFYSKFGVTRLWGCWRIYMWLPWQHSLPGANRFSVSRRVGGCDIMAAGSGEAGHVKAARRLLMMICTLTQQAVSGATRRKYRRRFKNKTWTHQLWGDSSSSGHIWLKLKCLCGSDVQGLILLTEVSWKCVALVPSGEHRSFTASSASKRDSSAYPQWSSWI